MASLPGPLVLFVGIGVAVFSYVLNERNISFKGPYALFMYIGLVMGFYGFIKTMIWYITRKSANEIKENIRQKISNNQSNDQNMDYQNMQKTDYEQDRQKMTIRCPRCSMLHYTHANFCQNCGTRLR